jgi:citrate synthase
MLMQSTLTGQVGGRIVACMSNVQHPGLEGVVAFATEIAEPDRDGGALRYRGVDLGELAGRVPFERVWGLLVDDRPVPGLAPAPSIPLAVRTGDARIDLQASMATLRQRPLIDIGDREARDGLALASAILLDLVAQAARGADLPPVPAATVDAGRTLAERFLLAWRGEVDPVDARAIDAYWVSAAEHGMNASTFTARVVASTGADAPAALSAAIGALSGPLHGGAPSRVLRMLDEVERTGDPVGWVRAALDRGERLMGFGHRVYRAEDPRARVLRRAARELDAPRFDVAEAVERAALEELRARKPDRVLATNVEFWSAVVLDRARVPQDLFTALFACARCAGWSAHILEQHRTGRLVRPSAAYVGREERPLEPVT